MSLNVFQAQFLAIRSINPNQKIQERSRKRRHLCRLAGSDRLDGKLKALEPQLALGNIGDFGLVYRPADGVHEANIIAAPPRGQWLREQDLNLRPSAGTAACSRTASLSCTSLRRATMARFGDLQIPDDNALEAWGTDRDYTIRIDDAWRIVFRWTPEGPKDVEIVRG
jgi:plasmid maintenance system killer protein